MNYRLFICIFVIFVFPVNVITHIGKVLEIVNLSIKGDNSTGNKLCRSLRSEINGTSITLCLSLYNNSSDVKESICKSIIIIYSNHMCNTTILNQLRNITTTNTVIPLSPEFQDQIYITFSWNEFVTNRIYYVTDSSESIITDTMTIFTVGNVTVDLLLVYRSRCTSNYYGLDCDIFCESIDNYSGHYKCDENGKPVCLEGWQDVFCTKAICDTCINGQCWAPNKCKCYRGWMGANCSICQKAIGCIHGKCASGIGPPFTCMCDRGWGGQHCDIDLKFCLKHQDLCQNNGTCHYYYGDTRMHYICKCAPGYIGRHCTIKSGECYRSICTSKQCLNQINNYKCRCYSGFSGSYCQIINSLQLEFRSKTENIKSAGLCVNNANGYQCSCSKFTRTICLCTFIECSSDSRCIDSDKSRVKCSGNSSNSSAWIFTSNFELSTSSSIFEALENNNRYSTHPYLTLYLTIIITIPSLVIVIIVVAFIIKYRYPRPSNVCINTIHNDLMLEKKPAAIDEEREQLKNKIIISQSMSFTKDMFLRNDILTLQNPLSDKKYSIDNLWDPESVQYMMRSPFSKVIDNSIVCNPNLLIERDYIDIYYPKR